MLSIKLNLLFYEITKLQLDWTLDGDGTPLYMTGILQASLPTFTKLALPGTIVLHEQIGAWANWGLVNILIKCISMGLPG